MRTARAADGGAWGHHALRSAFAPVSDSPLTTATRRAGSAVASGGRGRAASPAEARSPRRDADHRGRRAPVWTEIGRPATSSSSEPSPRPDRERDQQEPSTTGIAVCHSTDRTSVARGTPNAVSAASTGRRSRSCSGRRRAGSPRSGAGPPAHPRRCRAAPCGSSTSRPATRARTRTRPGTGGATELRTCSTASVTCPSSLTNEPSSACGIRLGGNAPVSPGRGPPPGRRQARSATARPGRRGRHLPANRGTSVDQAARCRPARPGSGCTDPGRERRRRRRCSSNATISRSVARVRDPRPDSAAVEDRREALRARHARRRRAEPRRGAAR